MVIAVTVGV